MAGRAAASPLSLLDRLVGSALTLGSDGVHFFLFEALSEAACPVLRITASLYANAAVRMPI